MARSTPNSSAGRASRESRRPRVQAPNSTNTVRPSPALMSWFDRAIGKFTAAEHWTYAGEVPIATRDSPRTPAVNASPGHASQPNALPDEVRGRFVRVGRDFYFPSGDQAFRDHGQKIVTRSENAAVVSSLIHIAQARGWSDITVTGTKKFRREAWRIATVSGLIVRGYRPTEFEKQKLVRELAAAREPRQAPEPLVDPPNLNLRAGHTQRARAQEAGRSPVAGHARADAPSREDASRSRTSDKRERVYSGTLLEHGPAPYQFHQQGEPSYFVRVQTQRGPTLLWGKDLERALHDARAEIGDEIRVRQAGRETVTVKRKERDEDGRVLKEHDVKAHRNQWEIRRDGESKQRDGIDVVRGAENISGAARVAAGEAPEIQGALLALKGAQLFADQRIKDPAQRSAFVSAVREELVRVLDRGDAVPIAQLRQRTRDGDPASARTMS